MNFVKMNGNGNDFIVINDIENKLIGKEAEIAKNLCDRHFGIGADGILLVRKSDVSDIKMVIINSDGSYASMCGNGIRCFAKYVYDNNIIKNEIINIETGDGIKSAKLKAENGQIKRVSINMGIPSFEIKDIPAIADDKIINKKIVVCEKQYAITSMLMGVPHTVVIGKLDDYKIEEGKAIEKLSIFPKGTNVNFCEVISRDKINVKTWERGAGPTLACGTGSCACVAACKELGLTGSKVEVHVPGGILFIEMTTEGIIMTGPAETCFIGELV
jgi:diaminopimelate epimerase